MIDKIEESTSATQKNVDEILKISEENINLKDEIKKFHLLVQEIKKDKEDIKNGIGVLKKHIKNLKSKVDLVENKLDGNMKSVVNLEAVYVKERAQSCRFRKN